VPTPPFPTVPPRDRSHPSASLSGSGARLRCAVCPFGDGLPLPRSRRASGTCRVAGLPAPAHLRPAHLAVSRRRRLGSRPIGGLSPPESVTPPPLHRCLEERSDPGSASGITARARPAPWWLSAPPLLRQDAAPIASLPRPPDVALCPRSGWLQGLAPPTSPYPARTLPFTRDQFLPWVCFPFEALLHLRCAHGLPVGPIPPPVPSWPWSSREVTTDGRLRLSGVEAATVSGHGLPGVLDVKEQLVANLGFAASSRRSRLSPLRRS
jgi:hypothetical protein